MIHVLLIAVDYKGQTELHSRCNPAIFTISARFRNIYFHPYAREPLLPSIIPAEFPQIPPCRFKDFTFFTFYVFFQS